GLLTLYVHIAYTLDLNSFFGEHAWYERTLAERTFREYPITVPFDADLLVRPDPEHPTEILQWPFTPELRQMLREFIEKISSNSGGDDIFALLVDLPRSAGQRLEMIKYFNSLSLEEKQRELELAKMVAASADDEESKVALPSWLLEQSKEAREHR